MRVIRGIIGKCRGDQARRAHTMACPVDLESPDILIVEGLSVSQPTSLSGDGRPNNISSNSRQVLRCSPSPGDSPEALNVAFASGREDDIAPIRSPGQSCDRRIIKSKSPWLTTAYRRQVNVVCCLAG